MAERNEMVIGITGGIGAGKSAVTDYLRGKGFAVVDADEAAREAVRPGEPALSALAAAFGEGILREDGTLDRPRLARLAFADETATRRLNEILHEDIGARIRDELNALREGGGTAGQGRDPVVSEDEGLRADGAVRGWSAPRIFVSAPLLYESGLDGLCDEVWLVAAPEDVRVARAAARDGLAPDEIRARAARQMGEGEKRARADVVIENTGGKDALYRAVDEALGDAQARS